MPFIISSSDFLFYLASSKLVEKLTSYGNEIDLPTRFSLDSLLYTFDQGLRGNLPQSYFLSSLDPGVGKTEAIATFIKVWRSLGFIPAGSILIGLQTKDEIRSLIKRLELDDADFAVLTRDYSLNALGRGEGRERQARILITTQQMIIRRTSDRSFSAASDFFYGDAPRSLRLWDESFILAQPVTITLASIYGLIDPLREQFRHFADDLIALLKPMEVEAADKLFAIPSSFKQPIAAIFAHMRESGSLGNRVERTLEALQLAAGRSMRLLRHGGGRGKEHGASGLTLVGATRPMPADFAPAIITDASGRVRGTYKRWEQGVGNLTRLPTHANHFAKVTFKFWNEKSGKDALADPEIGRLIFSKVAEVIDESVGEEWLLIADKGNDRLDVETEVRKSIDPKAKLRFLNWGRHHGTNAFNHIKRIMVIGSHFYDQMAYEALAVAASGLPIEAVPMGSGADLVASEYQHNMLQGVMRGNARNRVGGATGECVVYVVASPKIDAAALLLATFPGCTVEEWLPRQAKLTGQGKRLVDYLVATLDGVRVKSVTKRATREAIGIKNKQQLSTLLNSFLVKTALTNAGIRHDLRHFLKSA